MTKTIISKSGRIITLRYPRKTDLTILFEYINGLGKEDTYIFINPDEPVTYQEERKYLQSSLKKVQNKSQITYLAFHERQLIGVVDVKRLDRRQRHIGRFGITLKPKYRHDGIGQQLAEYIIQEAQQSLGIKQAILGVFANNKIAYKLYRKLGFQEYGSLPHGVLYKGQYIDEILMHKLLESA